MSVDVERAYGASNSEERTMNETEVPIFCTGGCDACRDYARELGVPFNPRAAQAEAEREGLQPWLKHHEWCASADGALCTCGLRDALEATR